MPTLRLPQSLPLLVCVTTLAITPASASAAQYQSVTIKNVPHIRQKPDFCGEACAAMYLQKLGLQADQDAVYDQSGLDPALGRGCYTRELNTALRKIGFDTGLAWYKVAADSHREQLEQQFRALHADLSRGVPSIICMHYDARPNTTEHFRLILGYDAKTDEVIYHEPAVRDGAYQRMQRDQLLKLWPLKYDRQQWTVIRMPLKKTNKPIRVTASKTVTSADYAQHVLALKKKLPGPQFQIVIQEPFVVVGDEARETVERRSRQTIKWAVDHLKRDYFKKDPERILDIWLFKDKESYDKHTRQVFGDKPTTPFGYYSSTHGALIMNIATGGGTLVHEIVHPFMASNFPGCPSWFNEGLASLYEQCGEKNGHIYGYTNWRLRGLQQAIRNKRVPSFKTLCETTTNEFYNQDPGTNYSQARYLCYYLQEKGLLTKYYHAFSQADVADPSGYNTLQKILGRKDMDQFKQEWEAYVAKLK